MSRTYSAIITALWVGLTVGISSFILEMLKVEDRIVKAIVFSIAIYVVVKILEKYKIYKPK